MQRFFCGHGVNAFLETINNSIVIIITRLCIGAALSGYLHITSNYITLPTGRQAVRLACAEQTPTSIRSLKPPDQRSKGMCAMARWDC